MPNRRQVNVHCEATTPPQGDRKGAPLLYYGGLAGAFVYSRGAPLRSPSSIYLYYLAFVLLLSLFYLLLAHFNIILDAILLVHLFTVGCRHSHHRITFAQIH